MQLKIDSSSSQFKTGGSTTSVGMSQQDGNASKPAKSVKSMTDLFETLARDVQQSSQQSSGKMVYKKM